VRAFARHARGKAGNRARQANDTAASSGRRCPPYALSQEVRVDMTGPEVLDVARDSIMTLVLVSAPLMLVGLVVGVVISLFQALTQIQEMTLVFVPKILAIFAAMLIALPFMGDLMQGHMTRLAARIMGG
jgi:flagellar biosynthetic protein FliQ